jgi:hypothetical protein
MAARYAITQQPSGGVRAAALEVYLGVSAAAPGLSDTAAAPFRKRREVLNVLDL